ncbi:MAG: FeoA family protein [Campylobacterota bacterium]|nr:FeoA family protein [Campylobacterota bacterium]
MEAKLLNDISNIQKNKIAIIEKITAATDLKHRLISLGFIKGNSVVVISKSLANETIVVQIGNKSKYALRNVEAKHILVKPELCNRKLKI